MPDPSLPDLLNVALDAAHLAGKRSLAYFNADVVIEDKPDDTPVTVADREAEDLCRATISKYFPDHTITGEERSDQKGNDDFTWIIDPIDGTKSFVHGVPLYGVLIGCQVRNKPAVGGVVLLERAQNRLQPRDPHRRCHHLRRQHHPRL
jgi:fructose-1,6-bisphosphatase/inositol monophosphatase family enzyme